MDDPLIKVLLIDDDAEDASLAQELLTDVPQTSFSLECAERLSSGLERLRGGGFDVVLLDLALPDSQGLETVLQTRDQAPAVPVVVLTGRDDENLALQAVQAGTQDYLIKGQADQHALVRSLRYAVERTRRRRAEDA